MRRPAYPEYYPEDDQEWQLEQAEMERKEWLKKHNIPDYSTMGDEELAWHVEGLKCGFKSLRNSLPNYNVPEYDPGLPHETTHAILLRYSTQVQLLNKIAPKQIAFAATLLTIQVVGKWYGIDLGTLVENQKSIMTAYECLLLEAARNEMEEEERTSKVEMKGGWYPIIKLLFMQVMMALLLGACAKYQPSMVGVVKLLINHGVELFGAKPERKEEIANSPNQPVQPAVRSKPAQNMSSTLNSLNNMMSASSKAAAKPGQKVNKQASNPADQSTPKKAYKPPYDE